MDTETIVYRIDKDDRIKYINKAWKIRHIHFSL